jgi:class 3 adenylate cyclase
MVKERRDYRCAFAQTVKRYARRAVRSPGERLPDLREAPDGARFCAFCGSALGAEPTGREERNVVSVVFVDLVGHTSRSEGADPEDVRALLAPYHARARAELERFGGRVEKFIGDAVMAVFGAPVAHEDEAERSVRGALAVRDAFVE